MANYYLDKKPCTSCGPGQYKNPSAHSCSDCANGKKSSAAVNANCENCGAGQYSFSTKLCKDCGPGQYSSSSSGANSECFSCASGKYSSGASNSVCASCGPGQYKDPSDVAGPSSCLPCEDGTISTLNANAVCDDCIAGTEKKSHTECSQCLPGKHSMEGPQSIHKNHECKECENGKFTAEYGRSTFCSDCTAGKEKESHTACSLCMGGQFSEEISNHRCTDCDAGKFSEPFYWTFGLNEQHIVTNVGVDVTQGSNTGTLKEALSGDTTSIVVEVTSSGFGFIFTADKNLIIGGITVLTDNINSATKNGAIVCKDCPDGYIQPSMGRPSCHGCGFGKHKVSPTECKDCEIGKISIGTANHVCDRCPAGKYKTSHTVCSDCPHGYYSFKKYIRLYFSRV